MAMSKKFLGQKFLDGEMEGGGGGDEANMETEETDFVNQLVGTLPGVDPNDPRVRDAMRDNEDDEEKDSRGEGKKD